MTELLGLRACAHGHPVQQPAVGTLLLLIFCCLADSHAGKCGPAVHSHSRHQDEVYYQSGLLEPQARAAEASTSAQRIAVAELQTDSAASGPSHQPIGHGSSNHVTTVSRHWLQHRRHLQHHVDALPAQSEQLEQWLQNTTWIRRFANGSCFPSGKVYKAANMRDLIRFVKDPSVRQIQLVGDIDFSPDLFPPENNVLASNDLSKGVNASYEVDIRACTGRDKPIIINCRNIFRQFYVDGNVTFRGSIKFINSFPSPRRGGLWALPSPLSIEDDGQIHMQGVQMHGSEPSALFNHHDPYWEVHNDSHFAPQPGDYTFLTPTAMLMHHWLYNRTAWLLHSQGANGLVRSTGDGYWLYNDVLITYTPTATEGRRRKWLALVVALPVVLGVLLLVGGVALAWWIRKKRTRHLSSAPGKSSKSASRRGPHRSVSFADRPRPDSPAPTSTNNSFSGLSSGGLLGVEASVASATTRELIEATRLRMRATSGLGEGALVLQGLLGEGTFGKVYTAMWKGTLVAVKTMLLPAAMSGKERREKMAIMETAISSSLSHPNIVQTYTYEVKPLTSAGLSRKGSKGDGLSGTGDSNSVDDSANGITSSVEYNGWEVRLVLELCDLGTLQEMLTKGGFKRPTGQYDLAGLVATASDVARAMHHLHTENIIHGDLKARNVLLKSASPGASTAGADMRGFVAKVSDFGLSTAIDPSETHVSNFYQGTLTHTAPEVLMYGKISFASDVYAYGIMLYEMYTGQQAFSGLPKALLGHEVANEGRRPEFPPDCPFDYQLLACRCWESDPAIRPSFEQVLSTLQHMSKRLQEPDSTSSLSGALSGPLSTASSGSSTNPHLPIIQGHLGHPRNAARLRTASATAAGAATAAAGAAAVAAMGNRDSIPTVGSAPLLHRRGQSQGSSVSVGSTGDSLHGRHVIPAPVIPQHEMGAESQQQKRNQDQQQQAVDTAQLQDTSTRKGGLPQQLQRVIMQQQQCRSSKSDRAGELLPQEAAVADDAAAAAACAAAIVCAAGASAAVAVGARGAGGSGTAGAEADTAPPGQQLQPGVSLGTWEGHDLWLSGSLAPVELQEGQAAAPAAAQAVSAPQQQPQNQHQQQVWGQLQVHSIQPGSTQAAATGAGVVSTDVAHLQPGVSLGSWEGGGFWPSGSLAPLELQQGETEAFVQLPAVTAPALQQQQVQQQRQAYPHGVGMTNRQGTNVGVATAAAAAAFAPAGVGELRNSEPPPGLSLGSSDGGGFWPSGTCAPGELQQVQDAASAHARNQPGHNSSVKLC